MFCVYLTVYKGNKLPPFYLGSTNLEFITGQKKYLGSVSSKALLPIWKSEKKHNRHLFKVRIISLHRTREEAYLAEDRLLRKRNAVNSPFYMNARCAAGLGFHPKGKDSPRFRVPHTAETKEIISKIHKGKTISEIHKGQISAAMTGRKVKPETCQKLSMRALERPPMSIHTKTKMQAAKLGKPCTAEHVLKGAISRLGCKWWNDGEKNAFSKVPPEDNFKPGRINFASKSTTGKKWWNNGITRTLSENSPNSNWVLGKLIK